MIKDKTEELKNLIEKNLTENGDFFWLYPNLLKYKNNLWCIESKWVENEPILAHENLETLYEMIKTYCFAYELGREDVMYG